MALQTATIDFIVKAQPLGDQARNIMQHQRVEYDNPRDLTNDGRLKILTSGMGINAMSTFKDGVKSHRSGDINKKEITFPVRMGMVSYIETIPTANYLNILFRHDSCEASHFWYDGDEGETREGYHYQPQVYFIVKVKLDGGVRTWKMVQSPLSCRGRMHPHNDSNHGITSGCCAGEYHNQLTEALIHDKLHAFLTLMSMYIQQGTNRSDEYGRSCQHFNDGRNCDQQVAYTLESLLDAKLLAYTMSDPEIPHDMDMSNQKISIQFNLRSFWEAYMVDMCRMSETFNPTTQEISND